MKTTEIAKKSQFFNLQGVISRKTVKISDTEKKFLIPILFPQRRRKILDSQNKSNSLLFKIDKISWLKTSLITME